MDNDSTNFLKTVWLCRVCLCEYVLSFQPLHPLRCPMSGWVCQWKPFWILVEDSFKKTYLEEWVFISDVPSEGPSSTDQGEVIPETPRCRSTPLRCLGSLRSTTIKHVFGNELRHHCLRYGHDQNVISFVHVSLVPFLSVWSCTRLLRK